VIEGVTGYSFTAGNVDMLSTAMLAAIHLSKDRAVTVKNCLEVMSNFTPEKAAARMLAGCEAIIEGRS
jgi:glycogen synthase